MQMYNIMTAKLCTVIRTEPQVCGVSLIFVLIAADGLCRVSFISPVLCHTDWLTDWLTVSRKVTSTSVLVLPRVEAGKNTSTEIPASRKRRRKETPVVSNETVMYGYESSATLTTDRLHYKLQNSLLVREAPQDEEQSNFQAKERKK
jgi:hypothetical protein